METLKGKALTKFGSHINTDDINPPQYHISSRPEDLAKGCLKNIDPDFAEKISAGGFVIAAKNFGCGSSRETAPIAIKAAGAKAVIAEEFARIFYRNAINIGLPCIECPDIAAKTDVGDELEVDLEYGVIYNLTKDTAHQGIPIPLYLIDQLEAGGLLPLLKLRFRQK
ncbi:3-isopropylmalate/(R)-2-methylmalate dehydratase small subunit [Sporobacter termitidis DSM 10068]|uniref:3-isopropylmalate dehydratase small subunit n=1 Tax=Sporobacter termitidis DSM 10068 TaxID=1123282 RepID=A0A1M5Z448_9FIRM|nr:hypothetical protein [Sporobacter termitidis]SHI18663.1 3-isopropylmalate/(R)-2-methylmalate dehydratase small subunit [Sporobacter termitidis DSM 10068]